MSSDTKLQRRAYPKHWGYSVTSICYRLGQLGWGAASAHKALQTVLRCKIELNTVRTGVSDGNNPKYEQGRAAPLTGEQIAELARAIGTSAKGNAGDPVHETPTYSDEVRDGEMLVEGACRTVLVNAYERDPVARARCIEAHGSICSACEMDFGAVYGPVAAGYIHVHHLRPLSEADGARNVDPVKDLRPVCPNCHAVLHRRTPPYSIADVRGFLQHRAATNILN